LIIANGILTKVLVQVLVVFIPSFLITTPMKNFSLKTLICLIALVAGCVTAATAQCNEYYILQEGSEWEFETYNGKGKLSGKNQQKVTAFSKNADGFVATVNSTMTNEKGKELMKGDLEFKCVNGTMLIDMRNYISEEQMKAYKNYKIKVEATNLEIPSGLAPGQSLKDGNVTVTTVEGPIPMKMTITISDRKVEAKESVTTPAGTFDCFKITSKSTLQNQMGVTMTMEFTSIEWIAAKVGLVKTESFNKNGKSNGYTILSKRVN
jgi:hypothetical protein